MQKGHYLFTSGDHYRTHNAYMHDTRAERLSDTVKFQHRSITRPSVSHGDRVTRALASFVEAVKSMTKGATAGATKAGVNMKDLEQLAEVTSRLTAQQPELARLPAPRTMPQDNKIPLSLANKQPSDDPLRRSPRLQPSNGDDSRGQRLQKLKVAALDARRRAEEGGNPAAYHKALRELGVEKIRQSAPRVSPTTKRLAPRVPDGPSVPRVQPTPVTSGPTAPRVPDRPTAFRGCSQSWTQIPLSCRGRAHNWR